MQFLAKLAIFSLFLPIILFLTFAEASVTHCTYSDDDISFSKKYSATDGDLQVEISKKFVYASRVVTETAKVFNTKNKIVYFSLVTKSNGKPGGTETNCDWHPSVFDKGHKAKFKGGNKSITGIFDGKSPKDFSFIKKRPADFLLDPIKDHKLKFRKASLKTRILKLVEDAQKAAKTCTAKKSPRSNYGAIEPARIFARQFGTQDLGHRSFTSDTTKCTLCKAGVTAAGATACIAVCIGTFGIGCGGCAASAAITTAAGILACSNSSLCCPNQCGSNGLSYNCCWKSETCLSTSTSNCCSSGKTPCMGKACCSSSQSCISQGSLQGLCCPNSQLCGTTGCCQSDETCINGSCCLKSMACGNSCCGRKSDLLLISHCASKAKSLCCMTGLTECGGKCCESGRCKNGVCDTSMPVKTREQCIKEGGNGRTCQTTNDCPNSGGGPCLNGCCITIKK